MSHAEPKWSPDTHSTEGLGKEPPGCGHGLLRDDWSQQLTRTASQSGPCGEGAPLLIHWSERKREKLAGPLERPPESNTGRALS